MGELQSTKPEDLFSVINRMLNDLSVSIALLFGALHLLNAYEGACQRINILECEYESFPEALHVCISNKSVQLYNICSVLFSTIKIGCKLSY